MRRRDTFTGGCEEAGDWEAIVKRVLRTREAMVKRLELGMHDGGLGSSCEACAPHT